MISQNDFALAARAFLDELTVLCHRSTPTDLANIRDFSSELSEMRAVASRVDVSGPELLSVSCGLVDEFATAVWERVISQAFDSYATEQRARNA